MPSDPIQLAHAIGAMTTEEIEKLPRGVAQPKRKRKNPAAVALGRLGGKKGGKARAAKLSPERRKEIARAAAAKRWQAPSR